MEEGKLTNRAFRLTKAAFQLIKNFEPMVFEKFTFPFSSQTAACNCSREGNLNFLQA
jgi:hypothetical protein